MISYIIRRLLLTVPTFLGITLLVFAITRFVPGGPVEKAIAAARGNSGGDTSMRSSTGQSSPISDEQMESLKAYYGLDKPVLISYFHWLGKLLTFDLGQSSRYGEPVWESIRSKLPISAFYGLTTMFLTYLISIPLGILKALKHKTRFDQLSSLNLFVGYALPGYVVGIALLVLLGSRWHLFPLGGFTGDDFESLNFAEKIVDVCYHAVLPLLSYMLGSYAVMTFLMKNNLLEQMSSDYVRTAMAKGLTFRQAVLKHALRNSLIPLATHFGSNISALLAGSFLIERIFNINGIGLLGYESVVERDYPVVLGVLVITCLLQLFGNILSDICVAFVDPRVRFH